jgi:hypothetical protein
MLLLFYHFTYKIDNQLLLIDYYWIIFYTFHDLNGLFTIDCCLYQCDNIQNLSQR